MFRDKYLHLYMGIYGNELTLLWFNIWVWVGLTFSVSPRRQVSPTDYPQVEQIVKKVVKDKQAFERLEIKKEDLLKMFEVSKQGSHWPGKLGKLGRKIEVREKSGKSWDILFSF